MITTKIEKLEQGNIKALFPNLGMEVISNGCVCQIIQISSQQIKVEITEAINPMYKVGNQIWVDSFLIPSDEKQKRK
jgi:hypothetical protein